MAVTISCQFNRAILGLGTIVVPLVVIDIDKDALALSSYMIKRFRSGLVATPVLSLVRESEPSPGLGAYRWN